MRWSTKTREPEELLAARGRLNTATGCILWTGYKHPKGYGCLTHKGKRYQAHVFAWITFKGPIPPGFKICHTCDTPSCINEDHLFLGTQKDNMQDAARKGRVRNGQTKLTREQVCDIRRKYETGDYSMNVLAREYGVVQSNISFIINGKRWK